MKARQPKGPICQSCGMPMEKPGDFGTEAYGRKSKEYCKFCFQKGKLTDPALTVEQMIDKVAGFMVSMMNMPEPQAKEAARNSIPKLKRWQC